MYISKIKIFLITGTSLVVIGLTVGGFIIWKHHGHDDQVGQNLDSSQTPDNRPVSQNSIPLTEAGPAPADTGGLSVSSSNASSSVGQLDGSSRQQAANASSSSSTASTPALNPSTFGEYEKYKDGTGALFGDMQVGSGTELIANHKAAVYYKGWLTNGQLFDESKPGSDGKLQPFIFTLGAHQVIPGWEQGLNGMKVGGTRLVIVPPTVGYGAAGQGSIPPNAVLVFQVQLLAVE